MSIGQSNVIFITMPVGSSHLLVGWVVEEERSCCIIFFARLFYFARGLKFGNKKIRMIISALENGWWLD